MNRQSHRARIALFVLLLPSIQALVTPDVVIPGTFPFQGQFSKHSYPTLLQQPATKNENPLAQCPATTSTTSLSVAYPGRGKAETWRKTVSTSLSSFVRASGLVLASLAESTLQTIRKYWWLNPMLLALIPPYSLLVRGTYATMPDWWSVVDMGHIAASKHANWVIAPFLGSNTAYGISAAYLMKKFGFLKFTKAGIRFHPTKLSMLGVWVAIAGVMSTIYHSVQALGSYALAENLCYIDHAIACSAIFYFLDTCGIPSKKTLMVGALSAVSLVFWTPSYAGIHSLWHFLSALTATRWAMDGHKRIFASGEELEQELEQA